MPFEDFDKKIKEAAELHTYSYKEESWQKMKALLDKHLPEKKERRRWLFLLFFFLLAGGGSIILLTDPFASDKNKPASGNKQPTKTIVNEPAGKYAESGNKSTTVNNNVTEAISPEMKTPLSAENKNTSISFIPYKKIPLRKSAGKPQTENSNVIKKEDEKKGDETNQGVVKNDLPVITQQETNSVNEKSENIQDVKKAGENIPEVKSVEQKTKPKKQANPRKSFLRNVAFTISAGPDISFMELDNVGKTKVAYGVGLLYRFSNRLAVRSGFFSVKKIYSAKPEDYNPPSNFWQYYPDLKRIDADCKIYEVPLNIDYNFAMTGKQSWFASAGLSSLFMKKETYDYLYKPPYSSQYVYYSRTYNNENKHYFSVLNLSAGYTRNISKSVSLRAEPYLKLPLSGIGYGKIKLSGSGILVTAIVSPFASQKKWK